MSHNQKTISLLLFIVGLLSLLGALILRMVDPTLVYQSYAAALAGALLIVLLAVLNARHLLTFFKQRSVIYGLNSFLMALLVLGILALINGLAVKERIRWDFTENKIHSLAEQSTKILEELEHPVTMYALVSQQNKNSMQGLLGLYKDAADDMLTAKYLDPNKEPDKVQTLFKDYSGKVQEDIVLLRMEVEGESPRDILVETVREENLTNGFIRLVKEDRPKIYFIEGHGEKSLGNTDVLGISAIEQRLKNSGNQVEGLSLIGLDKMPEDLDLFVVAGPTKGFQDEEIDLMLNYLKNGGRGLFLLDPDMTQRVSRKLPARLSEFGIQVTNSVVLDPLNRIRSLASFSIQNYPGSHPITNNFDFITLFSLVSAVSPSKPMPEGMTATAILKASQRSWGETDFSVFSQDGGMPEKNINEGDIGSPAPFGVAASGRLKKGDGAEEGETDPKGEEALDESSKQRDTRLVVVGDSEFITNQFAGTYGNHDLFLNMVNWLTSNEDLISIRPREEKRVTLNPSGLSLLALRWVTFAIIPLFFVGIAIWLYRRRRRL